MKIRDFFIAGTLLSGFVVSATLLFGSTEPSSDYQPKEVVEEKEPRATKETQLAKSPAQHCGGPHYIQCSVNGMVCEVRNCGELDDSWGVCVEDKPKLCAGPLPFRPGLSNFSCGCDNKIYTAGCNANRHLRSAASLPLETAAKYPNLKRGDACNFQEMRLEFLKWQTENPHGPTPEPRGG